MVGKCREGNNLKYVGSQISRNRKVLRAATEAMWDPAFQNSRFIFPMRSQRTKQIPGFPIVRAQNVRYKVRLA